ncbi:MAG TPA: universal stress protein [Candidatus Hydrogenedentes bacterium]|nr:universal stress protein [Candidatus Hydrogenedentota bacterium]
MIKRILVTTDGSESAAIGVRYAVALARKQKASILALHVVDVKLLEGPFLRDLSASLGAAPYVNYQGNIAMLLDERGKAALEYAAKLCAEKGVPCETDMQTGIIPRVIVEKGELVDVIVMGRTGEHNDFLEGLIGSTTEAVVRRASAPVLVTGSDTPGADHFVLAYDGSTHARKALKAGVTLASQGPRKMHLLVVGDRAAEEWLEEAKEYLQSHEIAIEYVPRTGDPGEVIVEYARECDAGLIVMGAYGHSKLRELVLGSATSYTINHATCPVLLVR